MTAAIRNIIRFYLNDRLVELSRVAPDETLLDWLRLSARLRGTKEGCAEGDCGACTVLVGRLTSGALRYETVNACIRFLGSLDGCHVVTVEHLAAQDGRLHPVQQAMVDADASQCGFCTPGFVMSAYALWMQNPEPTVGQVEKALQGNLCRCTGYEPIVKAIEAACAKGGQAGDPLMVERAAMTEKLAALKDGRRVAIGEGRDRLVLPASVDDLADVLSAEPQATIVAGATDVGLWVTKFMRDISPVVFIAHLDELHAIEGRGDMLAIGACVTYTEAFALIAERYPEFVDLWDRIGGEQVRNMGTIGGNVANGSPIGDTPPALIALDAVVVLRKGDGMRRVPIADFFIDYGKQDRAPGEFVAAIEIPAPAEGARFAAYKVSKRREEDISSVCGAFRLSLSPSGTVDDVVLAFGGMAATPKRASHVEAALRGKAWTEETVADAVTLFAEDFTPLTDWRASSHYRLLVAMNLLRRFQLETAGESVRLERQVA
ncbi:xanthine dehydrogenase small subunit [Pararhizobium haloflavum]|uniref:xanthine dehydrogenase small subunit n=1 Tax=Pararhizobium haloflavum TaxID=2037914 RepID=UPI000C1879E8|nr:xanthine dehydrogenase small subunit [Pararhizobium haloflavum]